MISSLFLRAKVLLSTVGLPAMAKTDRISYLPASANKQ